MQVTLLASAKSMCKPAQLTHQRRYQSSALITAATRQGMDFVRELRNEDGIFPSL